MIRRVILTIVCAVLCACGANRPTKETTEAIAALKKIQAGTQVGINYQEYGRLLIQAKAKVNDAAQSLPEGGLKTEITGAMDSYADASTIWGIKIKIQNLRADSEPGKTLMGDMPFQLKRSLGLALQTRTRHCRSFGFAPTRTLIRSIFFSNSLASSIAISLHNLARYNGSLVQRPCE